MSPLPSYSSHCLLYFCHPSQIHATSLTRCLFLPISDVPRVSRRVRVEFARGDGRVKRKEDERKNHIAPSETLFVVGFKEDTTHRQDLEMVSNRSSYLQELQNLRIFPIDSCLNVLGNSSGLTSRKTTHLFNSRRFKKQPLRKRKQIKESWSRRR